MKSNAKKAVSRAMGENLMWGLLCLKIVRIDCLAMVNKLKEEGV